MATSTKNPYKVNSKQYKARQATIAAEALAAAPKRAPIKKPVKKVEAVHNPERQAEKDRIKAIMAAGHGSEQARFLSFETELSTEISLGILSLHSH